MQKRIQSTLQELRAPRVIVID